MEASDITSKSAALLNDTALSVFTFVKQLPYLNIALQELQEVMEVNNVPMTTVRASEIEIASGTTEIEVEDSPGDGYPTDLIEIQRVSERLAGTTDNFIPLVRMELLPQYEVQTEALMVWAWQQQIIKLIGATTDRDVRIEYIASVFTAITAEDDEITVINAGTFLEYRTAALCAEFIGENKERADSLNINAGDALNRFLGISSKGKQAITTRRRPFMASFKARGSF